MRLSSFPSRLAVRTPPASVRASTSPLVLVLTLLVGLGVGALLVYRLQRSPEAAPPVTAPPAGVMLAEATRGVIAKLTVPIDVRVYTLFSETKVPENYYEQAQRINDLLNEMERFANGRIVVSWITNWSRETTQQAVADGLAALTTPQGEPCYLGLCLLQDKRRQVLAQLAPEWSSALEFDLARAIARVAEASVMPRSPEEQVVVKKAEIAVKQAIPNPATVSLDEGKQLLRDTALRAYQALVTEMNREVEQVEARFKTTATEADRQKLVQELQRVRSSYADKLRDVALRSQAEIEAWTKQKGQ